jgi:hypothetical protein
MADADWWDNPESQDSSPVIRHAPDAHNYHYPDNDVLGRIPNGRVGRFALIPAANNDGTSKGFDPTTAGPMHVDPEAPDKGVIFDPRTVTGSDIDAAVAASKYPHQAFYRLDNNVKKGITVAHQLPPIEKLLQPQVPMFLAQPVAAPSGLPLAAPGQAPMYYPQAGQAPAPQLQAQPQVLPPYVEQMFAAMQSLQQQIVGLAAQQARQAPQEQLPATTGVSSVPLPRGRPVTTTPVEAGNPSEYEARPIRERVNRQANDAKHAEPERERLITNRQTVNEYREHTNEPDAIITGFETLKLDFVNGPIGEKPKRDVIITVPNGGKHRAWFHDVVIADACIVLVYDTRYESHQFVPPELGDTPITLTVTESGKAVEYQVTSMGLTFAFGVFDMIMLIRIGSVE